MSDTKAEVSSAHVKQDETMQAIWDIIYKNNPTDEITYTVYGFYTMVAYTFMSSKMDPIIKFQNSIFVDWTYYVVLFFTTLITTYPLWPGSIKRRGTISVLWLIAMPFSSISYSYFFVLMSGYGHVQCLIFIMNLAVMFTILRARLVFIYIAIGVMFSYSFYSWYINHEAIPPIPYSWETTISYFVLAGTTCFFFGYEHKKAIHMKRFGLYWEDIEMTKRYQDTIENELLIHVHKRLPIENKFFVHTKLNLKACDRFLCQLILRNLKCVDMRIEQKEFNMTEIIEKQIKRQKELNHLDKKRISLNCHIEKNVIGYMNAYYIDMVVERMLKNAIKYTETGGVIDIIFKSNPLFGELIVIDHFPGEIPFTERYDIYKGHLYDLFEEDEPDPIKRRMHNESLSLRVCKELVDIHAGRFTVHTSDLPCVDGERMEDLKGYAFSMTLPLTEST